MNVLSLFDGMSCGQIALNRLGIKYKRYMACEIDKYAMKVTQANYPNTYQLGSVTDVSIKKPGVIDLLMGGSPCQGFSFAGKQLNFEDPRSKLFFEYVRLLKECKPKYFLLENVKMKKEYQDIISEHLGVNPIEINSSLVSAQNRRRLYWTNIQGVKQPENKNISFHDIIDDGVPAVSEDDNGERVVRQKDIFSGIVASYYKGIRPYRRSGVLINAKLSGMRYDSLTKEDFRKLTPIECERLQTVPENYTNHVSNTQRYKMLGNGWTVDVICHILKGIK